MESLGRSHPLSHHHHTHGSAIPVPKPQPPPAPEPIATGSKPHVLYRCLLNQHAQKMRKSPPRYQTRNEGSDHLPKFRSTVLFDGVSYTSSNTFPNLKMAEMDVSKVAYIAMIQKSKSEALRHIQEDKSICKSIMIEYSVKMNLERPKYVTSHQGGAIPVFSSQLSFNGATFSGVNAKSKKEAEQLVARAVILKYLDSEFANDMAEVINCKFRHAAEISKFRHAYNGTNVVGTQPCVPEVPTGPTTPATPVATQACIGKVPTEPTRLAPPVVTQPCVIEPITPAAPVVTQPRIAEVVTEPLTPAAPLVTQSLTPKVLTKPITPAAPVVTHPRIPKTEPITSTAPVVTQPCIPKTEPITSTAPVVTQPRIPKIEPITPPTATLVTHPRIPKVSTESVSKTVPVVTQPRQEGIRPAVRRPPVLAPTSSAQVNMVASAQRSGRLAGNPSLDHYVGHKPLTVVRRPVVFAQTPSAQVNMVASAQHTGQLASNLSLDRSVEHKPLTLQTPGRKRYWEDNKNAQKKMRVDTQRPVPGMHASPAQPFRSQSSRSKGNSSRMPHKNASRR